MTQIMVDILPETQQYLHAIAGNHPGVTFDKLAGAMLDKQVAYRLEVERMNPARPVVFAPTEYSQDQEYAHDFPSGSAF